MQLNQNFLSTTRGQIVALLRRDGKTIEELRAALNITDNAVRSHIAALERDGIVTQACMRPSGRRPAVVYELTNDAERTFSRAYLPVLTKLVDSISETMSPPELETLFRDVGERLAREQPQTSGALKARVDAAAEVLSSLGGVADVECQGKNFVIRGYACPLADAVRSHPATCHAARSLISELVGRPVVESCDKGERPRCRFEIMGS